LGQQQQQQQQQMPPLDFGSLMQQFQGMQTNTNAGGQGGGAAAPNRSQMHPADRYRSQLQQLRDMGFDDEQAALAALQANHGNLNRAVDQLLMSMGTPTAAAAAAAAPAQSPAPAPAPSSQQQQQQDEPPTEPKDSTEKKND
jgi:ribosomal protein L12E/L44/L45/RPP1/RPP2